MYFRAGWDFKAYFTNIESMINFNLFNVWYQVLKSETGKIEKKCSIALLFQNVSIIRHYRDVNVFIFLKNDRFVMQTTTKNRKRNDRFLKRSLFQKVRFKKMVVFIKIIVSLTIDNDDPSLTKRGNRPRRASVILIE